MDVYLVGDRGDRLPAPESCGIRWYWPRRNASSGQRTKQIKMLKPEVIVELRSKLSVPVGTLAGLQRRWFTAAVLALLWLIGVTIPASVQA